MSDWRDRIAALPPEKRALLERRLLEHAVRSASAGRITRRGTSGPIPLSFAQQRLWFLQQVNPESPVYHIARALRLRGPVDPGILCGALEAIVARHEALRTRFVVADGSPVQVVAEAPLEVRIIDLRPMPTAEREAALARVLDDESRRPFDLASGSMLRALLVRLAADDHALLLVVHHIAADAWSLDVLLRELTAHYRSRVRRDVAPFAELPIQYADFARWQRDRLHGDVLERALAYWRGQLADAPPVLALPTDRPRPPRQTYRGARQRLTISADLSAALRALSRREGGTLFMTLLAAVQALLFRYTGQEDILVGSPVSGRDRVETEGLIGFFVNTLVLRTRVPPQLTFRELLARVRDVALAAYAHQELPFDRLVEELHPERTLTHSPLVQVMFGLHTSDGMALALPGVAAHPIDIDLGVARFDLTLTMRDGGDALDGWLEYSTDLFDAGTIARMRGHLETMLAGIVADADRRVSRLPLLTDHERHHLAVVCGDTRADYPREACVHELVERQAARTPDAVAVVSGRERVGYAELNRRADHVARHLRRLGVRPSDPVGICVERSVDMVVGVLGILKAGGAYVPLDPVHPPDRLRFIVQHAGIRTLLTQERWLPMLGTVPAVTVCLDRDAGALARAHDMEPRGGDPTSDGLAYVLYTSGSTGRPKGVAVSHRAVVNVLSSLTRRLDVDGPRRMPAIASLAFDIATAELFLPLITGGEVHVISREVAADGDRLARVLVEGDFTLVQATVSTWRLLLHAGWTGAPALTLISTGEALPVDLARALLARGRRLYNLYGPTETTIFSTLHEVAPDDDPVPIGKPLDNTVVHVLDADLQPLPLGIPGEIYIGGDGVAEGYLGDPERTAQTFVSDPLAPGSPRRFFRTGDVARRRSDGALQFLGRGDHQIKLRGYRIEPGEIETVLREHPGVRDCAVVARVRGADDTRLVAYVVPADPMRAVPDDWKTFLAERLPDYMVPSAFVTLPALPVNPSGKLDRRALPEPTHDPAVRPESAPVTAMQVSLADIWKEVLGVKHPGLDDNFFDLGGHSLLTIKVIASIEQRHGVRLSPRDFVVRTLGELASLCEERTRALPRADTAAPGGLGGRILRGLRSVVHRGSA